MRNAPLNILLAVTLLCTLLMPGTALAAPDHEISVKLEFDDAGAPGSCADTTITFGAASCDGDDLLDEISGKMGDFAFGILICGYIVPFDEWECGFTPPAGCALVDIELRGLVGTDCPDDSVTLDVGPSAGPIGGFSFSLD